MSRGTQHQVRAGIPPSMPPAPAPPAARAELRQQLRIPVRPHADAVLYVPFPMTGDDWDQFLAVLAAMRPGLVRDEEGRMPG